MVRPQRLPAVTASDLLVDRRKLFLRGPFSLRTDSIEVKPDDPDNDIVHTLVAGPHGADHKTVDARLAGIQLTLIIGHAVP